MAKPIIPPDLRKKPRRPVNSDVERLVLIRLLPPSRMMWEGG